MNDEPSNQLDPRVVAEIKTRAAIMIYYRRHSHNPKITLKQVCEDLGVDYGAVRKAKIAYDKQRRRGRNKKREE